MSNNYGIEAIEIAATQVLETWENKESNHQYQVHIEHPEYTALCPRSGYPDMGTIVIDYIPKNVVVELKSIKLYINSFRDRRISHEDVTNEIANKFYEEVQPESLRVIGDFTRRGGIKTVITAWRGHKKASFPGYSSNIL